MAIEEIVTDPNLKTVLSASRDTHLQALKLVDHLAGTSPSDHASTEVQLETSKQQKLLITNLAQLHGLHRAAYFGARQTKTQTSEARQEVDRLHLQLQNLYYEQRHLQGEITACDSYELVPATTPLTPDKAQGLENSARVDQVSTQLSSDSKKTDIIGDSWMSTASGLAEELIEIQRSHTYQQLPLIPVEDFLALNPDHAADDEHTLMIARIEHERSEREALEQKRMELLKRKQKLIADNKKRKDDLENLDKELEKFIDSAKTITKLFDKNV